MKRLLILLVAVLAGLVLFSCKSSTNPVDDFDLEVELLRDVLAIFSSYNDGEETYAAITLKDEAEEDVTLRVNGVESHFEYSYPMLGRMFYFFDVDFIEFGSTFDYEIQIGDQQYSGSIKHPDKYETNFPEFDMDKDYSFDWTLSSNPEHQLLDYMMDGEDENGWSEVYDTINLKASARSYTLKKAKWNSLDNVYYADFTLIANNVKRHGSNIVVYAYSEGYDEEDWGEWKTKNGKLPKALNVIMKNHTR